MVPRSASLLLLLAVSCSSKDESKAPISDCEQNCSDSPIGGGLGGGAGAAGAAGAAGTAGAGGSAGAAGAQNKNGVKVQGIVQVHSETTFLTPKVYAQAALLSAAPSDVANPPAENWTGTGQFSLARVAVGDSWVKAIPTALANTTLGGLLQLTIDPTTNPDLKIPVVDTGVITTILGTLQGSPVLSPDAAHAVITFVDKLGAPLQGTTVTPAFTATTVYDQGPQFTESSTGSRGQALLLNVVPTANSAVPYLTKDGAKGTVQLLLEKQVVTFIEVVVP